MIVSRAPFRLSLGGGGTDLPSYSSQHGGFLVGASISKYVYILVNKRFYDNIRLSYSRTEIVDAVDQIQHEIFREAFKLLSIKSGIEVVSVADMPSNAGLGSSSCFTVALLNALHAYRKEYVSPEQLAKEACDLEIDRLRQPIGKQDQYIAAFGGLNCLTFERDGTVQIEPLHLSADAVNELQYRLVMFYTHRERSASAILSEQDKRTKDLDEKVLASLHKIKEIGHETRCQLERGNLDALGELLHRHWMVKRTLSNAVSDPQIDRLYEAAIQAGALGGKIMGAGGGGFFLFYVRPVYKRQLIEAMVANGLKHVGFAFDMQGAKIVFNVT